MAPADDESDLTAIVSRPMGAYRLLYRLGEGGMGIVHLALDPTGAPVAVKVLRPHVAGDEMGRARLAREVATLRRVRGPRVAEVLDADVDAPEPYIVTRYVQGPSLEKVVRERGPLSAPVLFRLAEGLAEALCSLGTARVVHRDIKPGNVLLDDGGPVLIDFGIARVADDSTLTATGLLVGTPGYLPPEVVAGRRATTASDVYSLAATLAYAATARPPFGQGPFDVVLANISRGVVDLEGVYPPFADLLRRMLGADPGARPTAAEVRGRAAAALTASDQDGFGERPPRANGPSGAGAAPVAAGHGQAPLPDTKVLTAAHGPASAQAPGASQAPTAASGALGESQAPAATSGPLAASRAPAAASHAPAAAARASGRPAPSGHPPQESPARTGQPPEAPPPRPGPTSGSRGVTLGAYAALVALAAVLPLVALGLLVLSMVVLRTINTTWRSLTLKRVARGRHWSDGIGATVMLPWRFLAGALTTALTTLLASFAAAGAFVFGWLATGSPDGAAPPAAAAAVASLQLWWGPGGSAVRHGWRLTTAKLVPTSRAATVGTLLFVTLAALAVAGALAVPEADWWPATTSPSELIRSATGGTLGGLGSLP